MFRRDAIFSRDWTKRFVWELCIFLVEVLYLLFIFFTFQTCSDPYIRFSCLFFQLSTFSRVFLPFNSVGPQNTKLISHDILENAKYETVNPTANYRAKACRRVPPMESVLTRQSPPLHFYSTKDGNQKVGGAGIFWPDCYIPLCWRDGATPQLCLNLL